MIWPSPPQPGQLHREHSAVEEQQRRAGLRLGRRGDMSINRQMAEKCPDLLRSELLRVPFAMKKDEAPGPVDVGLLRSVRVVQRADAMPQPVKQADRRRNGLGETSRQNWTGRGDSATIGRREPESGDGRMYKFLGYL